MKTLLKIIAIAIVLFGIETTTFAQFTQNPSVSATIIQGIVFTKLSDMNFGDLAVNNTLGTCILPSAAPVPTRIATGGVSFPASGLITNPPYAAYFSVTGVPSQLIYITIPSIIPTNDCIITNATGQTMPVNTYTTNQTFVSLGKWSQTLDGSGGATFYVGATVNVAASQHSGVYTNLAGFPVTVNYQ